MATHSSVLAWRIPGTGEPGGLWSMGSQSRTRLKGLSSSSLFYLQMEMMFPNQFSELISDPYHFKNWENFHQMQLWKKESYGCFLGAESQIQFSLLTLQLQIKKKARGDAGPCKKADAPSLEIGEAGRQNCQNWAAKCQVLRCSKGACATDALDQNFWWLLPRESHRGIS